MNTKPRHDQWLEFGLRLCVGITVGVLLLIGVFVAGESAAGLQNIGLSPLAQDQAWSPISNQYFLLPMIVGSLSVVTGSALCSVPLGIGAAIFLNFYAADWLTTCFRRTIELLAGIPSVVYGLWGMSVVVPWVSYCSPLGQGQSLLAGIIILSIMTLPIVIVATDAAISAAANEHVRAAVALGLSRRAIIWSVVIPSAKGGIATGVALQISRAIGETMAIVMICGNIPQFPDSLFSPIRTLTANIALEMGYADANHRSVLFLSGFVLMLLVAVTLLAVHWIGHRYRAVGATAK